jgi:Holliday junction resolvase
MLEKTVVKNIVKALDKHFPGFYFKTHGGLFQAIGLPDIIGLHKGRFIGIEVKVPGKEDTLTLKQEQVLRKISMAGGISFMATTPKQVLTNLKEEFKNELGRKKRLT